MLDWRRMRPLRSFVGVAAMLALALAPAALAQAPVSAGPAAISPASALPAFEVVSVKPFRPTGPWHRLAQFDPQRMYIEGMATVELINLAYSLNGNQLTGLPDWAQYSRDHLIRSPASRNSPPAKPKCCSCSAAC